MKLQSIFITLLLFTTFISNAQINKEVNTTDLIFECSKYSGQLPSKQIAIWYPNDFWKIVGAQMKFPPEIMNRISDEMENYLMFAVVDYTITPTGKIIFKSGDEILKTMLLMDSSKKNYYPLQKNEMSSGAKKLQEEFKPIMEKMLGQFGEGMEIIIFNAPNENGDNMLDITKPGSFTLKWDTTSLKWKLPFNSVIARKFCPIDNEEMKGSWFFCPEHGKKLHN